MNRRLRRPVVLLVTGLACLATSIGSAVTAQAEEGPGSEFGSFSLAATAPVVQFRFVDGSYCGPGPQAGCELAIPEALATLQNGPIGHALSSIAWPGTVGGNLGSTLVVAGAPPEAGQLNSPVRAETTIGQEPVVNNDYPGVLMTASATATDVLAQAELQGIEVPGLLKVGSISGTSQTVLTEAKKAVARSRSTLTDISLGGGAIHIGSLISTAEATTDATTAAVTGKTNVADVTVGGIPVTIDERGISVNGTAAGVVGMANELVNQVLTNLGITMKLAAPVGEPEGASIDYATGGLVVQWKPQEGRDFSLVLGGATVSATSAPGFDVDLDPPAPPVDLGGTGDLGGLEPFDSGSGFSDLGTSGDLSSPLAPTPELAEPDTPQPALAAQSLPLPDGLSPALVALALLGTGLAAAGLRALPGVVLAGSAVACPLQEER